MIRIVSGGQTGVDRGALDAALDADAPCGGWCPAGRRAEDGPIDARYPLAELDGASYRKRTRANVRDSDATAIIYFGEPSGGTEQTLYFCLREKKPYLLLDAYEIPSARAAARIGAFVAAHRAATLNIAGPRASTWPEAHDYAFAAVRAFLESA